MKNFFITAIGIIAIAVIVFFSVRYGVVNTKRSNAELERFKMTWADRR